ncbi:MAG TPA: hypothetical protein VH247_11940 [Thermoleophilaceae bacterium]|nr:hypothetical protein [Thermoleophilaceae bacterium]
MRRVGLLLLVTAAFAVVVAAAAQATAVPTCTPQNCGTWQPGPVSIDWASTDGGNVSGCPTSVNSDSPDAGGTIVSCDDGDGPIDAHVKVDNTPPSLSAALDRPPDTAAGWYNHTVTLNLFSGSSDALSGIANCQAPTYSGADDLTASLSGTCTDAAGNTDSSPAGVTFKYDGTPPSIDAAALDRPPDVNGWYNHPVGLLLQGNDATSDPTVCTAPTYSGPNGAAVELIGTCTDQAGNSASRGTPLAYDDSAPEIVISADRLPDHDGWYNHPVAFSVSGLDTASGIASCAGNTTYSGPQDRNASVGGLCTDGAGNSGGAKKSFAYDSTRPGPASIQVTPGNHRIDLSWSLPSDAASVIVVRAQQGSSAAPKVVYAGSRSSFLDKKLDNGAKYTYTVTDLDQAGNQTSTSVRAIPTASSLRPFVGSVVSSAPLLTWKTIKGARYYNVQLWLGKKKVLSTWPRTNSLQLKQSWHFRGKTLTLVPGHYRWYVWPGFGNLFAHRYGNRIGRSSFRVR